MMVDRPGRLLSQAGASFAVLPVPDLESFAARRADPALVDIELLTPDRLVRYLGRRVGLKSLDELAGAYMDAASVDHPEVAVPSVQDREAGLLVSFLESTPFSVTVEIQVNPELEGEILDPDGLSFDVTRAALVTAAIELREWLGPDATERDLQ
ncbi:hypothetical protein GCM10022399_42220 [Terrabacter ginsenosidimutans]|uniref:Uncharacterized protein n=1 Tax=Terrabacter ginsenosidimutans TaxID=490575 RepID=A0ABP7EPM0_9MICO